MISNLTVWDIQDRLFLSNNARKEQNWLNLCKKELFWSWGQVRWGVIGLVQLLTAQLLCQKNFQHNNKKQKRLNKENEIGFRQTTSNRVKEAKNWNLSHLDPLFNQLKVIPLVNWARLGLTILCFDSSFNYVISFEQSEEGGLKPFSKLHFFFVDVVQWKIKIVKKTFELSIVSCRWSVVRRWVQTDLKFESKSEPF